MEISSHRLDDRARFGAFEEYAARLGANGFSTVPLAPGLKQSAMRGWADRLWQRPLTSHEIDAHARRVPGAGLGVAGGYGRLVAIDVDSDDEAVIAAVLGVLPPPLVIRLGRRGLVLFYRLPEGASLRTRHFAGRDGLGLVDIIGIGAMVVLPPSLHPAGDFYRWGSAATLVDTPIGALPVAAANLYDLLAEALAPWLRQRRAPDELGLVPPADAGRLDDPYWRRRYLGAAAATFRRHQAALPHQGEGGRNAAVFAMVRELGWAVHRGLIGLDAVQAAAIAGSRANGWLDEAGEAGVVEVVRNALRLTRNDGLPQLKDRAR